MIFVQGSEILHVGMGGKGKRAKRKILCLDFSLVIIYYFKKSPDLHSPPYLGLLGVKQIPELKRHLNITHWTSFFCKHEKYWMETSQELLYLMKASQTWASSSSSLLVNTSNKNQIEFRLCWSETTEQ